MAVKLSLSLPHGPLPALKPQGSAGILMLSSFQAFHMYPHQLNGSNLYLFAMAAISLAMVKIRLEIGGCIGTGQTAKRPECLVVFLALKMAIRQF